MKYIRTKDGVYEINEEINYDGELFYYVKTTPPRKAFEECEILKQADTIEELCDGFIGLTTKDFPNRPDIEPNIYYFNKPFEFQYGKNVFKRLKLIDVELKNQNGWCYSTKEWFKSCDIYGFIRTDKGLIYVAKLNDKGELELI